MEAECKNYEVLVKDKRAGKSGGAGPSNGYETWSGPKRNDEGSPGSEERMKLPSFQLSSKIERVTNLGKVLEERILDSQVELML